MIVFELSMPNKGSWNRKWSQEGQCFVRCYPERTVPKEYWGQSYYYSWDDGWTACVSVTQMQAKDARKLEQKSKGFCGYDWMISSIIEHGDIRTQREWEELDGYT